MLIASLFLAQVVGSLPLGIAVTVKTIQLGSNLPEPKFFSDMSIYGIDQNLFLALSLLPFVASLIAMWILLKPLHERTISETVNGTQKVRWKRFFTAFGVWFSLSGILLTVNYWANPTNFEFQAAVEKLIPLVVISVLLIPIQSSYEELFMRGYLAQGIGAWTRSRICAVVLPAIPFALLHSTNPEVHAFGFWTMMPQYLLPGLVFGLVSVLDDGIEIAMGAHVANNIFAAVLISNEELTFQTPAVFAQLHIYPKTELVTLTILCIVFVAIMALIYKWDFGILRRKIERHPIEQ